MQAKSRIHWLTLFAWVVTTAVVAEQNPGALQFSAENASRSASRDDRQVVVQGEISDSARRPLNNAEVNIVLLSRRPKDHSLAGSALASVVGRTTTDSTGAFTTRIPRTRAPQDIALEFFAYAKGHGIAGRYLELGQDRYDVRLQLPLEITTAATLVGPAGEPLPAASIRLCSLSLAEGSQRLHPFQEPPSGLSAWPQPYVTAEDGGFLIHGAHADTEIVIELDDKRVARQRWTFVPGKTREPLIIRAESSRVVEGQVVAGEARSPIADAIVVLTSSDHGSSQFLGRVTATTDSLGRFTLRPYKGTELSIRVITPDGKYPPLQRRIRWVDGTTTQRMTLPMYGADYERLDGTTPDGRLASTIDSDYPTAKVDHRRPSQPLRVELGGTILAEATFVARAKNEKNSMQGLIAIDPDSGQWRMLISAAREPRVSRDGRQPAYTTADTEEPQIVSFQSLTKRQTIASRSVGPTSWVSGGDELVVNVHAPARREYQGEEYWGEECERWRVSTQGDKMARIPLPDRYSVEDISPDGQWLAMHWDTHASLTGAQLFIARVDGSDLRPVARKKRQYYWYPRFSPNGKTILAKHLNATNDGPWISARIIALNGSQERSIVVGDNFHVEYACWSPDGQHIAISAHDDNPSATRTSKLFLVNTSGTQIRELALANVDGLRLANIDWTAATIDSP
jgi:hypothetical protein